MTDKKAPPTKDEIAAFKAAKKATPAFVTSNGIAISPATDLTPGSDAVIGAQDGFDGRALLFPHELVKGIKKGLVFVAYGTRPPGSATVTIPGDADVANILYADLPNGVLPIDGQPGTLFDQITAAVEEAGQPVDSGGTGNNTPPHNP